MSDVDVRGPQDAQRPQGERLAVAEAQALWAGWTPGERRIVGGLVARLLVAYDPPGGTACLEVWTPDAAAVDRLVTQGLCERLDGETARAAYELDGVPSTYAGAWPTERLSLVVLGLLTQEDQWAADLQAVASVQRCALVLPAYRDESAPPGTP